MGLVLVGAGAVVGEGDGVGQVCDTFSGLGKDAALLLHGLEQELDTLFDVEGKVGSIRGVVLVEALQCREIHQDRVYVDAAKLECCQRQGRSCG